MPELYELGMDHSNPADPDTAVTNISDTGALIAYSGLRTGRSPTDKRIIKDQHTTDKIWWGSVNIPLSQESF